MSAPRAHRACAWLALLSLTVQPAMALAEPSAADKALAEGLFQDGRKLMDAGQIAEACTKFAESQRIDPTLGTLLNMAVCHEKEGRTASAWAEFKEASAMAASSGQQDRADFAGKRAGELETRLSRLSLEVAAPAAGMVIKLNGKELSATAATGSGIPVDPGEATIEALAPGRQPWSKRVAIEPGPSTQQVTIPALADAPAPPPAAAPKPKTPPRPATAPRDRSPLWPIGFAVGGVGLVGIGVGAVFGVVTLSRAKDVERGCQGGCTQDAVRMNEDAKKTALLSDVAFGAGIACLGAGVTMLLLSRAPSAEASGRAAWISPEITSTSARMIVGGRW